MMVRISCLYLLFLTLCLSSHLITGSIQNFFSKKNSVESTSSSSSSSSARRSTSKRVSKGWTECSTGITTEKNKNALYLIKAKSILEPKLNSCIESKRKSKTLSKTEFDFLSGCALDCESGYGLGLESNRIGPFSSLQKTLEKDEKFEKIDYENDGKSRTEELHGNSTTQDTEIANCNAEYEKEIKLNLSVLYGIPSSKIKKTTPKKVSKFFRKISLNGAENKNNHENKVCKNNDYNSKNNGLSSSVSKIEYDNCSNVNNNNVNNNNVNINNVNNNVNSHDNNNYNDDNSNNYTHKIVQKNNDKLEKIGQLQNLDNNSNLMQFQFNSGINHENQNSNNISRTYDQFSFQETKSVKSHTMTNEFSSITQHTYIADTNKEMICNTESWNKNEIENEMKNGDKNENENEKKSENNEDFRSDLKESVRDDDNEVEIIEPHQSPFGYTHTYAQAHTNTSACTSTHTSTDTSSRTHTRHDDSVKRVMTRTEKQPAQKKRLVGTSKPFSR